jgi:hypothetical protein
LDSVLEIGFKNYLIFEKQIKLEKTNAVLQFRDKLHKLVKEKTSGLFEVNPWTDNQVWKLIDFYYEARCDLYHEIAEKTLSDSSINDFQELVGFVLDRLFVIQTADLVKEYTEILPVAFSKPVDIHKLKKPIDLFIVAVAHSKSKTPKEIVVVLTKLGARKSFDASKVGSYLANYGHLFHTNPETGIIELSESGRIHYQKLEKIIAS